VDEIYNLPLFVGRVVTDYVVTSCPSNGSSIRSLIPEDISSHGITSVCDGESWNVPPFNVAAGVSSPRLMERILSMMIQREWSKSSSYRVCVALHTRLLIRQLVVRCITNTQLRY
jgi:hypothetical protein